MTSTLVLPPTYSSDELPQYSQSLERSPAYSALTLMSSNDGSSARSQSPMPSALSGKHVFSSKRLSLDLGPRQWATKLPTYGRNGLIEGHVEIKDFKHVERVELTLTGQVLSYMLANGSPSLRSSLNILSEKSIIWSADSDSCSSDGRCRNTFPFIFALPDYITGAGPNNEVTTPLPPSASVTSRGASAHVFYSLRVDMFRRGVRFHDSIQTEILYLPKTMSRYERPYIPLPGSEKPRRICDAEWRSVAVPRREVRPTTKPAITETAFSNVDVHLSLPHKLHYPSGCSIPFAVTLSGSGLSCANIPQLAAGLKMTLMKTSTAIVRGIVSKIETVVSTGTICRIDEDERHWRDSKPGENARQVVIRGCLETGAKGKDMSWGVRGYAGVSYQVRVGLTPGSGNEQGGGRSEAPIWEGGEAVVITSHEWEGRNPGSEPALGLTAASRTPMSISLLNGA